MKLLETRTVRIGCMAVTRLFSPVQPSIMMWLQFYHSTPIRLQFDRPRYDHSTTYVTVVSLPVCGRAAA